MFILSFLMKLIKIIGSETSPVSLASAMVLGFVLAFNPWLSIQSLLCILCVLFLRVNIATAIFSLLLCSGLFYLCTDMCASIGVSLLEDESLRGLWTYLYNSPIFSLTYFYNSLYLGALICTLIGVVPVFFGSLIAVKLYRHKVEPIIRNSALARALKASKLYKLYVTCTSPVALPWGSK